MRYIVSEWRDGVEGIHIRLLVDRKPLDGDEVFEIETRHKFDDKFLPITTDDYSFYDIARMLAREITAIKVGERGWDSINEET